MINCYWTTFKKLAEIERDCKERQLCMGDWLLLYCLPKTEIKKLQTKFRTKIEICYMFKCCKKELKTVLNGFFSLYMYLQHISYICFVVNQKLRPKIVQTKFKI